MQKKVISLFLIIVACSGAGCARRLHNPNEVVSQEYLHRYGVPVEQEDWHARGETGKVISKLKNGVVVTKSYANGVLEGDSTYSYPHSEHIERTETYVQGQLVKETTHYRNGTISSQSTFPSSSTKLVYTWFDNGTPQSTETYTTDMLVKGEYYDLNHHLDSRVDNSQGSRTRRDPFGGLIGVDTIQNGITVLTKTYYPNNAVKQITPYANGQIHGEVKAFLPGSEPSSIETWYEGEQTGLTTVFENGEKIAEIPYVRGVKSGVERRYRNGRIIVEEISWNNDARHGPTVTIIGDVMKTDYFYQGKNVSKSVFERLTNGVTVNSQSAVR